MLMLSVNDLNLNKQHVEGEFNCTTEIVFSQGTMKQNALQENTKLAIDQWTRNYRRK